MDYRIFPPDGIVEATISLPPAKSIAIRQTVLCWLSGDLSCAGSLRTTNSDADTLYTALEALDAGAARIDVRDCGAAMRFVTALAAATDGCDITIDGSERMHHRPVKPLADTLRHLGADITYLGEEGFPPMRIRGRKLSGGSVSIDGSGSSQYTSALMLATPLMQTSLDIRLDGIVQSAPYIAMTAEMLRRHGVEADMEPTRVTVANSPVQRHHTPVEADWSAAAFWYEIAAVSAGWLTLKGLTENSIQGDSHAAELFERLGVVTEFTDEGAELSATPDLYSRLEADLTDMPDSAPALAVTAALTGIPFRLSGLGALHAKECDRVEALAIELAKLGIDAEIENYGTVLSWDGTRRPITELPVFEVYGDHRMAMALAPAALFLPGIVVKDAQAVAKSYPDFWNDLQQAGFVLADPSEPLPQEDE